MAVPAALAANLPQNQTEPDGVITQAWQVEEWHKCATSFPYFADRYGYLIDPMRGRLRYRLYPFQKGLGRVFQSKRYTLVNKGRQMGVSWLAMAYAIWLANFHPHKSVLIISIKNTVAKDLLDRARYVYMSLPPWLRSPVVNGKQGDFGTLSLMVFANGSRIESIPTSREAARSKSLSLLIVDEAAFIRWIDEIWGSAQQTLATGGQAIVISTPNGVGNWFHGEVVKSSEAAARDRLDLAPFFYARVYWHDHPERDAAWYEDQRRRLSPLLLAQEVDGDFISSGTPVFDSVALREIGHFVPQHVPLSVQGAQGELVIFQPPRAGVRYVIGADTSSGEAKSAQAAVVQEEATGRQVAEFRGFVGPDAYSDTLAKLGMWYNTALLAPEINNTGNWVVACLQNVQCYPNLYHRHDPITGEQKGPGFATTPGPRGTRAQIITNLEVNIRSGDSGIVSARLLNECMTFVWDKGTAVHAPGCTDDLVMAKAIADFVGGRRAESPRDLPIKAA